MNEAAQELLKHTDFSCFSRSKTDTFTNDCNITFANWELKNDCLVFTITANRFLRNMVRAIVGTLLEIGQQKIGINELTTIITSKNRGNAGTSAPAHGLYLTEVKYPIGIFLSPISNVARSPKIIFMGLVILPPPKLLSLCPATNNALSILWC